MKNVLITGASSGIGFALAHVYAKHSYNLILVARREDRLRGLKIKLEQSFNISVSIEIMDLTERENLIILTEKYKDVDILINNAGLGIFGEFYSYSQEVDDSMLKINIDVPVTLTKLFANQMKKGSKIINIASTAGFQPVPYMAVYSAAKSFIVDFTLAIQREYKDINIILFCPGETKTEFQKVAGRPKSSPLRGRIPEATEVAEYLYKMVKKNNNFIIWGRYNRILIFFQRFFNKKTISNLIYKTQVKSGGNNVYNKRE